jgi:hypothetical protein
MARKQPNRQALSRPEGEIATPIEERIRIRAYEIWLQNGCRDGCDIEEWLEAEREVRGETAPRTQTMSSAA